VVLATCRTENIGHVEALAQAQSAEAVGVEVQVSDMFVRLMFAGGEAVVVDADLEYLVGLVDAGCQRRPCACVLCCGYLLSRQNQTVEVTP